MLKTITLENFRNYGNFSLDFADTTILIGPNGVGKTNIIEAIYAISTGRSWRTSHDMEAINWEHDLGRIKANVKNDKEFDLEMLIQRNPVASYPQIKIIKINSVKKKLTDLLGKLPAVLFSPEQMQLVSGAPNLRRRFLDIVLCQVDKKYTQALLELTKIIRGRNKLLYYIKMGKSKAGELDFWDEKLIDLGSFIINKRTKLVKKINEKLSINYQTISGTGEGLQLKYKTSVDPEQFADMIVAQREREIEATATLFGPHRDDIIFLLDSRDLSTFGSRGEFRSAILALKIAELDFLKENSEGVEPVLLLDDIFSELDANRRLHLGKIVANQQTIITTTDLDHIEKTLRDKAKIVELEGN